MDLDFLRVICWKKRMCVSVCLSNCYNKHVNVWSERRVGAAEGMWLAGLACHTPFVHQPHTTVQPPHASTSTRVVQLGACHWAPVLRSRKKRACPSLVFDASLSLSQKREHRCVILQGYLAFAWQPESGSASFKGPFDFSSSLVHAPLAASSWAFI